MAKKTSGFSPWAFSGQVTSCQGLKPLSFWFVSARLKSCPDTKQKHSKASLGNPTLRLCKCRNSRARLLAVTLKFLHLPSPELSSRPERTRISCHATLDEDACAAFVKESSMQC